MTNFKFVKRPLYVLYGPPPNKDMEEMFCKVCGTAIGGMTSKVKGRRMTPGGKEIEEHTVQFRRFHNYAEVKIAFTDGSFHVTNGCNKCLNMSLTVDQMRELHVADMQLEPYPGQEKALARIPKMVVAIRVDGGGIL